MFKVRFEVTIRRADPDEDTTYQAFDARKELHLPFIPLTGMKFLFSEFQVELLIAETVIWNHQESLFVVWLEEDADPTSSYQEASDHFYKEGWRIS